MIKNSYFGGGGPPILNGCCKCQKRYNEISQTSQYQWPAGGIFYTGAKHNMGPQKDVGTSFPQVSEMPGTF